MFRAARWRTDKNKIKAVFKLQFHATQVGQVGVEALVVSVVPGDVGKPTLRLEKAVVKNGCCRWENFVYETVKFVQDPRTGKINQKIYHFIVSSGSTKAGNVGEVSIDLANYAEAVKPSYISLPLKSSNSNALLHVSIQRVQANVDQRESEENEDSKNQCQDRTLGTQISNSDSDEIINNNSVEVVRHDFVSQDARTNSVSRASSGSDITMSSSDSSSGLDTPREAVPNNNASATNGGEHQRSQWEWAAGSDNGPSTDNSSTTSQVTVPSEKNEQSSDNEIEKLKAELQALARQVDISELELQTLRKQIVKESKRGQDFSKEIITVKEERDALKAENERLKGFQKRAEEAKFRRQLQGEGGDVRALVEEIRQELHYEKDLNANLRLQLQKTQESNAELILAVQDLEEMLDQKNKEISCLPETSLANAEEHKASKYKCETDEDEEQRALEELVKEHNDTKDAHVLERRLMDLQNEIEIYRRDKDELEMQMEQLALDYEILKQENHDISCKLEQSQLQEQLKMQYECSSSSPNMHELDMQFDNLQNEFDKQSKEYSASLATISELQNYIKSLEEKLEERSYLQNEFHKQSKQYSDSLATISELQAHIKSLEEELEKQAYLQNEFNKQSKEYSDSLATISELQAHTKSLEGKLEKQAYLQNEVNKQSEEYSNSLATISELQAHIKSLEEELEKQAQGFEADLEAMTHAKVEQEQRAIRAEEALRKTRWRNACTAEKLREEFNRLSVQMASSFAANEKVATKALTEANELRTQKSQLEEVLQRVNEELQSVRSYYEAKVCELSSQVDLKTDQMEQLKLEAENRSMQLEVQKRHEEEVGEAFSQEIQTLKEEIEKLKTECNILSKEAERNERTRAELEELKASLDEADSIIQRGSEERNELVRTIDMVKGDAENSLEELNSMRCLNGEKNRQFELLQSELEELKAQCNSFQQSLHEDESEKERLRKQVFQLKTDLKKKEDAFTILEKKFKDSNGRTTVADGTKASSRTNKPASYNHSSKEVASLREKIRLLEGQIKLKETALETTTNSFLEKEKDFQKKIEDLESCKQELSQQVVQNAGVNEQKDVNLDDLYTELESLRERNSLMEGELKEMQERYSEISLKFAEVEGERQQLVMTLRNLKNTKKS